MRIDIYVFLIALIAACCAVDAARTGRIDLAREMVISMRRDRTVQRIAALWARDLRDRVALRLARLVGRRAMRSRF
jgi:hypothetical protein